MNRTVESNLLDSKAAAKFLGVSFRSLEGWRVKGFGPKFVKLGKLVRYRPAELTQWLNKRTRSHTVKRK